jgi:kynureninase
VRLAAERALDRRAAPWSIRPADWFDEVERLRALFARVAGADPDGIAIVPSTSYGMAVAQLAAAIVAEHVTAGSAFPSESGFTTAFVVGAIATLALAASAGIPGRRHPTPEDVTVQPSEASSGA